MRFVNQILSLFLAVLVFVAGTGFTLHKHFCGNTLQATTVIVAKKSCCGEMNAPSGNQECHNCCHNETEYIKADINVDMPVTAPEFKKLLDFTFLTFFVHTFFHIPNELSQPDYLNYKPPLLDRDIPVLIQSFLI